MERILGAAGYVNVVTTTDPQSVAGIVAEGEPDLVLLDLLMPEMDGFTFLAELQRRGAGRAVPVIVLTAKDLTPADHQRLSGPIEKILRKESLGHEQLLAEVSALMAGYDRRK